MFPALIRRQPEQMQGIRLAGVVDQNPSIELLRVRQPPGLMMGHAFGQAATIGGNMWWHAHRKGKRRTVPR